MHEGGTLTKELKLVGKLVTQRLSSFQRFADDNLGQISQITGQLDGVTGRHVISQRVGGVADIGGKEIRVAILVFERRGIARRIRPFGGGRRQSISIDERGYRHVQGLASGNRHVFLRIPTDTGDAWNREEDEDADDRHRRQHLHKGESPLFENG